MTVSGDVDVGRVGGALTVRAVSGDVTIGAIDADRLVVSTTSGDIDDPRSVVAVTCECNSVSGDVRVGVARGTRVWIDAASSRVISSPSWASTITSWAPTSPPDAAVVPLHVKTVSGDVSIVRAAEALAT